MKLNKILWIITISSLVIATASLVTVMHHTGRTNTTPYVQNSDLTEYIRKGLPISLNVVQVGGSGSELYTATAWVDVEGGIPIPANDLVSIGFTRAGDMRIEFSSVLKGAKYVLKNASGGTCGSETIPDVVCFVNLGDNVKNKFNVNLERQN